MKHQEDHKPTNREKAKSPKQGKAYCGHCDRCLVGNGEKCGWCGKKNKTNKLPRRDFK